MTRVNIGDAELEYFSYGSGEPVVLVHGSASDYRSWRNQQKEFSSQFRTITYSRRYHWPNDPISAGQEYSMNVQVEDLRKFLKTLNVVPAHLVGHSYGAFLCLLLAIKYPDLIRSLVLSEPPALTLFINNNPSREGLAKLFITHPLIAASIYRFASNGFLPARQHFKQGRTEEGIRTYANVVFSPGFYDRLSSAKKASMLDNKTNVAAEILGPGFLPLDPHQLRQLHIPTLLITGQRSIKLFQYIIDRLEKLIPNTERSDIPDASHMMHVDNAEAYNSTVLSFLSKNKNSMES